MIFMFTRVDMHNIFKRYFNRLLSRSKKWLRINDLGDRLHFSSFCKLFRGMLGLSMHIFNMPCSLFAF